MLKGILRKKNWILRSWFKVPDSATPNEIDRESVQKRVWVSEWVVMSCQESLKILLVQETVVSVVMMSFPRQKTNKPKLAKQCGRQASKLKT